MANAVKCNKCGNFEEGHGYSVRIYKTYEKHVPEKGTIECRAKRLVTLDNICGECAEEIAGYLGASIFEDVDES